MKRTMTKPDTHKLPQFNLRMPEEIRGRLITASKKLKRDRTNIINAAIAEYLDKLEEGRLAATEEVQAVDWLLSKGDYDLSFINNFANKAVAYYKTFYGEAPPQKIFGEVKVFVYPPDFLSKVLEIVIR